MFNVCVHGEKEFLQPHQGRVWVKEHIKRHSKNNFEKKKKTQPI